MTGASRQYAFDVSEHFFRLTTESVRIRSNETRKYQTLGTLVNARTACAHCLEHDPAVLRSHLDKIPTKGDIRIYLRVKASSADSLSEAQEMLAKRLGVSLSLGDTLSVLLFDYIVEQKALEVLGKLKEAGLDEPSAKRGELNANESQEGNVIRLN
ncbi:MAG: hypothetical protein CL949_00700 [Erythrobacter sp.]|nr:hypothetical protein [Erythrobacter sp.]|tara:strand:+ start:1196 stop:1663 length:468 start_codon:yes stop_codon:yes gene_type:complete